MSDGLKLNAAGRSSRADPWRQRSLHHSRAAVYFDDALLVNEVENR